MSSILLTQQDTSRKCENGIFEEYMKYVSGQESPQDFHMWVCVGLIAIALGRNSYVDMSAWRVYPNLYIILVGESALTHKSTALKMGIKRLKEAVPSLNELAQKFSPESLSNFLSKLSEKEEKIAEAFIHASELSVLFGHSKLDDTLLKLLTDLWDSPDSHKYMTLSRGIESAENICINMLGGTTPDWLKNSVPEEALEGGFFSRLILVDRPATGRKNPFPVLTPQARDSIERVKHDLAQIRACLAGEYTFTPTARMAYGEWYSEYNKPEKARSFMRGYYGRKGDFVLKIAMIHSASFGNSMKLSDEDILFAINLLNENEVFCENIVKFLGTTQDGKKYINVLSRIKKSIVDIPDGRDANGVDKQKRCIGIEHSKLMRGVGYQMKAQDLSDTIDALVQADEIREVYVGTKKVYVYNDKNKEYDY